VRSQPKCQMDKLDESLMTGLGRLCQSVHGIESNNAG